VSEAKFVLETQKIATTERLKFFARDQLSRYIIIEKGWHPLWLGLVSLGIGWGSSVVYAFLSGTLLPNPNMVALLEDYTYMITETITMPLVWIYYVWVYKTPAWVIESLENANVVTFEEEELEQACKILDNKLFTYVSVFFGILVAVFYTIGGMQATPQWLNQNPAFLILRATFIVAPGIMLGGIIVSRIINTARIFRRLLKDVVLHPLHPDKAGGLQPLGRYALGTTYLIAIAGSLGALLEYEAYTRGMLGTAYFAHIVILLYLILAPVAFFAPLSAAHRAMQRAKESLLLDIAYQFNQDFSQTSTNLTAPAKTLEENVKKINQLRELHKIADAFPVWPFDVATLRRFAVTISSPIATIALSVLIDLATNFFVGS